MAITAGIGAAQATQTAEAVTGCARPSAGVFKATPATYAKTVALTFDDGPGPWTSQIVSVLKAKGVHATFFETGNHASANPAMSRLVVATGNLIGNHTYNHPQFTIPGMKAFDLMTTSSQTAELNFTTWAIQNATAETPCFFRGPGGHQFGATTQSLVKARNMWNIYWSQATGDSAQPGAWNATAINRYVYMATTGRINANHPIILMHDGEATPGQNPNAYRGNTVAALPRIIDWYKARGYVFTDPSGRGFTGAVPAMKVSSTLKSAASVKVNQAFTASGTTKGIAYGTVITFQRSIAGKNIWLGTTTVTPNGTYSRTFSSSVRGVFTFRVLTGTGSSNWSSTKIV